MPVSWYELFHVAKSSRFNETLECHGYPRYCCPVLGPVYWRIEYLEVLRFCPEQSTPVLVSEYARSCLSIKIFVFQIVFDIGHWYHRDRIFLFDLVALNYVQGMWVLWEFWSAGKQLNINICCVAKSDTKVGGRELCKAISCTKDQSRFIWLGVFFMSGSQETIFEDRFPFSFPNHFQSDGTPNAKNNSERLGSLFKYAKLDARWFSAFQSEDISSTKRCKETC